MFTHCRQSSLMTSRHKCKWKENLGPTQIQTSRMRLSIVVELLLRLCSGGRTSNAYCSCSWFHYCFSKVEHMVTSKNGERRVTKGCSFRPSLTDFCNICIYSIGLFKCLSPIFVYLKSLAEGHGFCFSPGLP